MSNREAFPNKAEAMAAFKSCGRTDGAHVGFKEFHCVGMSSGWAIIVVQVGHGRPHMEGFKASCATVEELSEALAFCNKAEEAFLRSIR